MSEGYEPIAAYALIADCHAAALVSRHGSIDWCCLPRFDSGAYFARLLDAGRGGYCSIGPVEEDQERFRRYLDDTLVLETTFRGSSGEARLIDCFTMTEGEREDERELIRVLEGRRGRFEFEIAIAPRFDYGAVDPWMRHHGMGVFSAIGGDDGLLIWSDLTLESEGRHELRARGTVRPGERVRLALCWRAPPELDDDRVPQPTDPDALDQRLEETIRWWREWSGSINLEGPDAPGTRRSAIALKALTYSPTGAIVAAPTTSLPESRQGGRNWDYRYSWIRDSAMAARSLARLGYEEEAGAFRRFIERSAAGNAKDLQVMFGVGGERRLTEQALDQLEGYEGNGPVRIGNGATGQLQLDAYGHLLDQSWLWYERGHEPDDDYWRFLLELVDAAVEHWREPDRGIWEWRGEPRHFVHSKALCWVALDRGLKLAEHCMRKAPEREWRKARDEIREAIESDGYDAKRGAFVQGFDAPDLDAAVLRLPGLGFIDYEDERMLSTVDAIREELTEDGLVRRYSGDDGLPGREATFVPCTFWLAECLARQGRLDDARETFDRAISTSNDLGLLSEEYDPERSEMRGNFPQALSHLSHMEAALALAEGGVPAAAGSASEAPAH